MRIGIFDSGIGGLSTLLACLRHLPDAHYLFYGDSAHAPYGDKSPTQVRQWTEEAYAWFISAGVDAVVLACNTATSAAVAPLRERADIPIIGIEPAIRKALTDHPQSGILLLATSITVNGEKLRNLLGRLENGQDRVRPLACSGLAEIIETQDTDWSARVRRYLQVRVQPARTADIGVVVLGCTHYCWINNLINDTLGGDIAVVDGNDGVARQLCRRLGVPIGADTAPSLPRHARISLYFTADNDVKSRLARQLLAASGVSMDTQPDLPHARACSSNPGPAGR
ncbi:MAG: glutamate racemase [Acidithiobacillus ferriphilus]|jgi:glutamate racemase|uniref:glutamate racemase n=1 Tax=Acidithiobacillus ferriphilus TaxID=1689834 RepID=UPI001C062D31|nr:glutamate racemase [Acidithiobacillus ferriphilus]MBU2784613.1 glutamate racemase [Acidithiobacillus ferriphilus]MBU2827354.1 glutamate racemase [Acidithiobacillus ferriphilus]MBU2845004.1 glutamate racemase [Acidithiobacillus ferriphilus]MEB8473963.1 glutamate racemase [Acidithiobacillus ferriphilus]UEP59663.1 glutamate racemase [Acidithiobacillus ferriphilus]